jgi:hypothetical protein
MVCAGFAEEKSGLECQCFQLQGQNSSLSLKGFSWIGINNLLQQLDAAGCRT